MSIIPFDTLFLRRLLLQVFLDGFDDKLPELHILFQTQRLSLFVKILRKFSYKSRWHIAIFPLLLNDGKLTSYITVGKQYFEAESLFSQTGGRSPHFSNHPSGWMYYGIDGIILCLRAQNTFTIPFPSVKIPFKCDLNKAAWSFVL